MSEEMALAEWLRARECLGSAWLCQGGGFHADAISRAYYAVLHAAKAALQTRDIHPDTHKGLRNLFGLHIVRVGLLEPEWSALIAQLNALRQDADYTVTRIFDESYARVACERAQAFLNRIRVLLATTIPPENLE
jgi:uncharacterized protein (UPF0332 family)